MKQLRLWIDDSFRVCLLVKEGREKAHLLHVPTLDHFEVPMAEVSRQMRRGVACEVPVARGLISRIEAKRKDWRALGYRFSEVFVRETLAIICSEEGRLL